MEKIGDIQWNVLTPAIIRVKKNGGLESGYHDLEIDHRFSSSYMPPDMDEVLSFGSHKRRLLLI